MIFFSRKARLINPDTVCAEVYLIDKGIVPPLFQEIGKNCFMTYSGVLPSVAIKHLSQDEATLCKRKFRKIYRKAFAWYVDCLKEKARRSIKTAKQQGKSKDYVEKLTVSHGAYIERQILGLKSESGKFIKLSVMRRRQRIVLRYLKHIMRKECIISDKLLSD